METKSPVKIESKIKNYSVVNPDEPKPAPPTPAAIERIIVEAKPYERSEQVTGSTYKIKPATSPHALYITINNIVTEDGRLRPIELFINSKDVDHQQWIAALTRVISALFRKPGPFLFIIDELVQVYDPRGGYWAGGEYVTSVVAEIGKVLKRHCEAIGAIEPPQLSAVQRQVLEEKKEKAQAAGIKGTLCGKCNETAVVLVDNCMTCLSCGDSKCG